MAVKPAMAVSAEDAGARLQILLKCLTDPRAGLGRDDRPGKSLFTVEAGMDQPDPSARVAADVVHDGRQRLARVLNNFIEVEDIEAMGREAVVPAGQDPTWKVVPRTQRVSEQQLRRFDRAV